VGGRQIGKREREASNARKILTGSDKIQHKNRVLRDTEKGPGGREEAKYARDVKREAKLVRSSY